MVGHSQVRGKLVNFILFIMVGLVLVGIGGFFWWHDKNLRQECTAQTAGVVIDEGHSIKNKNGRRADKYRPTFAYSVEGVEYTKQTPNTAPEGFLRDKASLSSTILPNRNDIIFWKKEGQVHLYGFPSSWVYCSC